MNFCSYLRMHHSMIMCNVTRIFMCRRKKNLSEARNLQGNVYILHHIIVSVLKSRKSISYPPSWIFPVFSHQTSPQERKTMFCLWIMPSDELRHLAWRWTEYFHKVYLVAVLYTVQFGIFCLTVTVYMFRVFIPCIL